MCDSCGDLYFVQFAQPPPFLSATQPSHNPVPDLCSNLSAMICLNLARWDYCLSGIFSDGAVKACTTLSHNSEQ